jgi:glycosyltransferase involved in cell wall biosynthesis
MKLLIVSDMPHYRMDDQIVGWGPTVREIDHLASLFDEIQHIGFLYDGLPPDSMLPYGSGKVLFVPLEPAGGIRLVDKVRVLASVPSYVNNILKHLAGVDVLHVRCPSNVGLVLMLLLPFLPKPKYRWIKYAGNWRPAELDNWSYAFQRFWLNLGFHRGIVTVNGKWGHQPHHVFSFLNPSLENANLDAGRKVSLEKTLTRPVQILYVGRVETAKGCGRLLDISRALLEKGVDFEVHIVGDGEERPKFERKALELGLDGCVKFHGWLSQSNLFPFYARAHFLLLPTSASEGWPKVLSEAMAYGVIPLAGAVSSIPQILSEFKIGKAIMPDDKLAFANAIATYLDSPSQWQTESQRCVLAAQNFTYEKYLLNVKEMVRIAWGLTTSRS